MPTYANEASLEEQKPWFKFGEMVVDPDVVTRMKEDMVFRHFVLRSLEKYLSSDWSEMNGEMILADFWLRGTGTFIRIKTSADRSLTLVRFRD